MNAVIEAVGGLANRLRVVLSWRARYASYGGVDVIWRPNGEIAGARFEEVFEPLPGVRFFDDGAAHPFNVHRTCDPLLGGDFRSGYQALRLLPHHHHRYAQGRTMVSGRFRTHYAGIHVRRTDIVDYTVTMPKPTDEEFVAWAAEQKMPVHVATDNGTTQVELLTAMVNKGCTACILAPIPEHERQNIGGVRNTPLADAAIDLFLLAGSKHFLGTTGSSFTNAVHLLRQLGGWWSP